MNTNEPNDKDLRKGFLLILFINITVGILILSLVNAPLDTMAGLLLVGYVLWWRWW